jgi:hypothetical protein
LEDNTTIADYYDGPSNPTLKTIKMLNSKGNFEGRG